MAVIENLKSVAERRQLFESMDVHALVAQQLVQRRAEHALQFVLENGATREVLEATLQQTRAGLMELNEVANARGVQLVGYQAP